MPQASTLTKTIIAFLRASALATLALAAVQASSQPQEEARIRHERDGGLNHGRFEPKEWQEEAVPPPPEFDIRRLVPLDMPHYMSLRFGVDPKTMSVTGDGVVRYVVVAYREGTQTVNAFYEGVRCATDEYKTYARYSGDQWNAVTMPEWKRIDDRNSVYTHQLAKQSLCAGGRAPRSTVADMIRELKQPEIQRN